jgi:hypothetical protein
MHGLGLRELGYSAIAGGSSPTSACRTRARLGQADRPKERDGAVARLSRLLFSAEDPGPGESDSSTTTARFRAASR